MEDVLLTCSLFKGLDHLSISQITDDYPHKTRIFQPKEFVIFQDDSCENLMIVIHGNLQAQMVDSFGKLMIVDELGISKVLAPAFIFSENNRMPVSLLAMEETEILYFRKAVFLKILQTNETILINYLQLISNKTKFLSEKLKFHAFKSIKNKIAHYLLEQSEKQGGLHIKLPYTQEELASRFGITRPSLSRSFAELEKENIIHTKGKEISILEPETLKRLV